MFQVSGLISSKDQACKEEYLKTLSELESQHFVLPADKLQVCVKKWKKTSHLWMEAPSKYWKQQHENHFQ